MHALTTIRRVPTWSVGTGVAVIGAAAVVVALNGSVLGWSVGSALFVAAIAAMVDLRSLRLPDELVLVACVPTMVLVVGAFVTGDGSGASAAMAIGVVTFAGPLLVLHLASPAAMGFGDVKLGVALGAALGMIDPTASLLALCIASGVTGFVGLALRRSSLPFGPGLVAGAATSAVTFALINEGVASWR